MNEDTIKLLKELNAGCKSGTNSMEQVMPHVENESTNEFLNFSNIWRSLVI
jgi:hypothetical protein